MILDKLLEFDSAAAITVTRDSTNIIDFGLGTGTIGAGRDMSVGDDPAALAVLLIVTTALTAVGAATLTMAVEYAPDDGTGAEGAYKIAGQTEAMPKANLTLGAKVRFPLPSPPPDFSGKPRFCKLVYTVATGPFTAGAVTAELTPGSVDQQNTTGYPSGFSAAN